MTEHLRQHETESSAEADPPVAAPEHLRAKIEQVAEQDSASAPSLESIRHNVAEQAHSGQETYLDTEERPSNTAAAPFVTRRLKRMAQVRILKRIRGQLPLPEQALSRLVHQPVIDALSEAGGKTIARPSGLLSGGICAFLGSSILLYIDKHDGYRYNFLLWAICFVGGFLFGLLIEALLAVAARLRS